MVLLAFILAGAHPILALFSWLINTGTLAIVAAMTVTSFAIALFFSRRQSGNRLTTVILPVIAGLILAVIGGLAALRFDILVGSGGPLAIALPLLVVVTAGAGALIGARR